MQKYTKARYLYIKNENMYEKYTNILGKFCLLCNIR